MQQLFIDTSLKGLSLALLSQDKSVTYLCTREKKADSSIATSVKDLLSKTSISPKDISRIVVSKGPGSFTGIRLGLAWVYGFANTGKCIVNSESSLEMAARYLCVEHSLKKVFLLIKNTKTSGFLATASATTSKVQHVSLSELPDLCSGSIIFMDSSWNEACNCLSEESKTELSLDDIADRGLWGMVKYSKLSASELPLPLYLKKSSVEEKQQNILKDVR
jgi:tRNA threonylcarbamoyl adenosine modification protein YeaZ